MTTPTPAPVKPRVQQGEDRMFWFVHYPCCDTRRMRLHDWTLALRIANGHECPQPRTRPKRTEGYADEHGTKRFPGADLGGPAQRGI